MSDFLPLLKVNKSNIKSRAIVCGDPKRAEKIANVLDEAKEISYNREYRVFNGVKNGVELTIASHGVGAPGAAICFEELIRGGVQKIIRVGTAGSLQREITDGDLVIASGAVRKDGLTHQLIDPEYPALADPEIVGKLEEAGREFDIRTHTGIVLTIAAFYPELLPLPNNEFSRAGVLAVEMEVSALFVIASLYGVRAGAILAIDGMAIDFEAEKYNPHRELVDRAIETEIELALKAITQI